MGWLNIYAAVFNENHQSIFDLTQRYGKQLLWIGAGVFLAVTVMIVDSKFYVVFAYAFYAMVVGLLIFVLLFGKEVHGAKSWIEIGGFALQPAELGKFATNLAVAKFISRYNFKMQRLSSLIGLALIIGFPALLIIAQNDTGSALVYTVFILVLYREGLSGVFLFWGFVTAVLFVLALVWSEIRLLLFLIIISLIAYSFIRKNIKVFFKAAIVLLVSFLVVWFLGRIVAKEWSVYFVLLISSLISSLIFLYNSLKKKIRPVLWVLLFFFSSLGVATSVDFVYENVLESHHRNRIDELLGIKSDPKGAGYNVNQSKIAIGSGGFTGKGFLKGTQTKYNFVPEQSTDFIFCTVGEEWGFVGTTVLISLFLILLLRILFIAERQRSNFSRIYGYGVASILFFHVAVNIGMTIGLAPVIGIPLPFFSYGGSSLWAFTVLLFIFLRLDASRMEVLS